MFGCGCQGPLPAGAEKIDIAPSTHGEPRVGAFDPDLSTFI